MKKIFVVFFLSFCFVLFSIDKELELTIFFTNDTNGHPLPFKYVEDDNQGGLAARAALIKELSKNKKRQNTLILDAGGIVRGRPESNLFDGIPDIVGMNNIKYDAAAVGISELWDSLEFFEELKRKANFTFLNGNVCKNNEKKENIAENYIIKKIGGYNGIKVGIFSVITEDVIASVSETTKSGIIVNDPVERARIIVAELKDRVDIIVALTHLGYYPDGAKIDSEILAKEVPCIDIIIDGRTGLRFDQPITVNNTKICQSFKWGLFFGEINLTIKDKEIFNFQYQLHPVNYKENGQLIGNQIEEDKFVGYIIKNKMQNYDKLMNTKIATVAGGAIDPRKIRTNETAAGNMICDALIDYTGADVAFQNAGGIDENLVLTNEIIRKTFDGIIKYDNTVVLVRLNGYNLKEILKYSMQREGTGAFLQVGGIRFTYSKMSKEVSDISINGEALDNKKEYRVAINSWLAEGGDGYKIFRQITDKIDLNIIHREIVHNYLGKIKEYKSEIDGRINIIN